MPRRAAAFAVPALSERSRLGTGRRQIALAEGNTVLHVSNSRHLLKLALAERQRSRMQ
jgi:hypothetical protein